MGWNLSDYVSKGQLGKNSHVYREYRTEVG